MNKNVRKKFILVGVLLCALLFGYGNNAEALEIKSLDFTLPNSYEDYDLNIEEFNLNYKKEDALADIRSDFDTYYNDYFCNYFDDSDYYKSYHKELDDLYYEIYYNYMYRIWFGFNFGDFKIYGESTNSDILNTTYGYFGYFTNLLYDGELYGFDQNVGGYLGYLKFHDKDDSFTMEKMNHYKLDVSLKKKNATTVVATYTLKNTSDKDVPFKLAGLADTELGKNDRSAISKVNNEFVITQDAKDTTDSMGEYVDVEYSYGAQFGITLNPTPTTMFVGPYANDDYSGNYYYEHTFENSERDYYTKNDGIDSALAYSWQGTIKSGETKTYTATFHIKAVDELALNFYHYGKETPTDESPLTVVGGGGFKTPMASIENEAGYNVKWYSNKDGSGKSYYPDTWSIAPDESMDFYEVKKSNTVVNYESEDLNNYFDAKVIISDDIVQEFVNDVETSYDDVKLVLEVNKLKEEDLGADGNKIEKSLDEEYEVGAYFDASLFKLINNEIKENITKTNNPIKISLLIPKELINNDKKYTRVYKILRLHDGIVKTINGDFDEETGEFVFDSTEFSLYAIVYKDVEKELVKEEDSKEDPQKESAKEKEDIEIPKKQDESTKEKEDIENPKTGDNIYLYMVNLLIIACIGIPILKKDN